MALPAIFWWVVLEISSVVLQHFLLPKPGTPQPKAVSEFEVPTADGTRCIPVVFGSVTVTGPNVVWYGNVGAEPFKISGQTVGYYYTMGMDLAVCHGPVDSIDEVLFDDKHANWTQTGSTSDYITADFSATSLFGGNTSGGGVKGSAYGYLGTAAQPIDSYLQTQANADYPGLSRVCHVVLRGGYKIGYGGVYVGTSTYLKPMSVKVTRCPNQLGLTSGHHRIANDGAYDANPACMLYEILTDTTWGLGISSSEIDATAFAAVGDTLWTERLGLAMIIEQQVAATETIREILRHIDGGLATDPQSGRLTLKLIRADYTIGTITPGADVTSTGILVLDETKIDEVEFSRGSWSETFNIAKVNYTARAVNYQTRTAQLQNLSNLQVTGRSTVSQIDYRGLTTYANAMAVCGRVLKVGSYPLGRWRFKANRKAWALRQCDVFVMNYAPYGITNMVCRVTKPAGGELANGMLQLEAVEDAFAIAATGYNGVPGAGWDDPLPTPTAITQERLVELPYQLANGQHRKVMLIAKREEETAGAFAVWDRWLNPIKPLIAVAPDPELQYCGFCPTGTLTASYPANTAATDTTGFTIQNLTDVASLSGVDDDLFAWGVNLALIDNEIIGWQNITGSGGTRTITYVMRGLFDTVPAAHASGARVWFFTAAWPPAEIDLSRYSIDMRVTARMLPMNAKEALDYSAATELGLVTASRASLPLPAGNVLIGQIGGTLLPWPTSLSHTTGGGLNINWAHRNRAAALAQDPVVKQDDSSLGTIEGTFTVEIFLNGSGTPVRTTTGITLDTLTYTTVQMNADTGTSYPKTMLVRITPVNGALVGTPQDRTFAIT